MTIMKRQVNSRPTSNVDDFISGAPDATHEQSNEPTRRRKEVISLGIDPTLLARVDSAAAVSRFVDAEGV